MEKGHSFSHSYSEVIITWFAILPDLGIYVFKQNVLLVDTVRLLHTGTVGSALPRINS